MGNKLYVDSNIKKFTNNKSTSLPIELLTDVKLPIVRKSNIIRQSIDSLGNKLYLDISGDITHDTHMYMKEDRFIDISKIDMIIGDFSKNKDIFYSKAIPNMPYLQNVNYHDLVSIDEHTSIGLDVDDVLNSDSSNLLEDSVFNKAIIDIMDCIVGGTYNNYCSYKVSLDPKETVIFNMEANITQAVRLYNIPLDLDIYVNSIKIAKDNLDDYLGILYNMESIVLNIKLVNVTARNISVINPIILFT